MTDDVTLCHTGRHTGVSPAKSPAHTVGRFVSALDREIQSCQEKLARAKVAIHTHQATIAKLEAALGPLLAVAETYRQPMLPAPAPEPPAPPPEPFTASPHATAFARVANVTTPAPHKRDPEPPRGGFARSYRQSVVAPEPPEPAARGHSSDRVRS